MLPLQLDLWLHLKYQTFSDVRIVSYYTQCGNKVPSVLIIP